MSPTHFRASRPDDWGPDSAAAVDADDATRIHPSAKVDPKAAIEPGVEISRDAMVGPEAVVSHGARIGPSARVDAGATICSNAELSGGVKVRSGALVGQGTKLQTLAQVGERAMVGNDAAIGWNARVEAGGRVDSTGARASWPIATCGLSRSIRGADVQLMRSRWRPPRPRWTSTLEETRSDQMHEQPVPRAERPFIENEDLTRAMAASFGIEHKTAETLCDGPNWIGGARAWVTPAEAGAAVEQVLAGKTEAHEI